MSDIGTSDADTSGTGTSGTEDLDALSSAELHDRAITLAKKHHDLRFLWDLLSEIPAAKAATGEVNRSQVDMLHVVSLLTDYTRAGQGDIADALRPIYLDYLRKHEDG